jgi:hypothetical protein
MAENTLNTLYYGDNLEIMRIQPASLRQTNITYQRGQRVARELGYTQSSLLDGGEAAE